MLLNVDIIACLPELPDVVRNKVQPFHWMTNLIQFIEIFALELRQIKKRIFLKCL